MNEMEDLIASKISTPHLLRNVLVATKQFEEIALTLWVLSGILNTLHVLIARSPSSEEHSSSSEENHIVRLTIINKLDLSVPDAENQLLDDVLMHLKRNGIQNISFALSA